MFERTDRDHHLLDTLCHKVACFTIDQIARTWWSEADDPPHHARRRLRTLRRAGFIEDLAVAIPPMPTVVEPLVRWRAGEDPPAFDELASIVAQRPRRPVRRVRTVRATELARLHYGGVASANADSDREAYRRLALASVYLRRVENGDDAASQWVGSNGSPRVAEMGFDALLTTGVNGDLATGVVVVDALTLADLPAQHQSWQTIVKGYELW